MVFLPGTQNTVCDVAGIDVGHADDATLRSGATVIKMPPGSSAAVDVRGGGPGTRETDALGPLGSVDEIHAVVLAGGSAYGLAAAGPVQDMLAEQGIGFAVGDAVVPIVPAAIVFDLLNGGEKPSALSQTYAALGANAMASIADHCPIGSVGAGMGAQTALYRGGLGSASCVNAQTGVAIAALAVTNPLGCVTVPGSPHFLAAPYECVVDGAAEFGGAGPWQGNAGAFPDAVTRLSSREDDTATAPPLATNTTLVVVATNLRLDKRALGRLAAMAHTGMARAIAPVHSPLDGDLVYAVGTGEVTGIDAAMPGALAELGEIAARVTARAIARGVYTAAALTCTTALPSYRTHWS